MKRFIVAAAFLLLNIFMESIVFVRLNLWGTRPDSVVAVVTAISIVSGAWAGTAYAIAAGLLLDLLFGQYMGLMSLIYMVPAIAAGLFYRRFYADNRLFPCIVAGGLYIAKELLFIVFLLIMRIEFNYFGIIWRYLIPSALLTSLITYPVHGIYRRLDQGQVYRERYR